MDIKLNDYHKKVNAEKIAKVAYWKAHPLSRTESLRRLKLFKSDAGGLEKYNSLSPRASKP